MKKYQEKNQETIKDIVDTLVTSTVSNFVWKTLYLNFGIPSEIKKQTIYNKLIKEQKVITLYNDLLEKYIKKFSNKTDDIFELSTHERIKDFNAINYYLASNFKDYVLNQA